MTPEERAEKLTGWLWDEAGVATDGLTQKVAEAIRAARTAAFEEAAKIAEGHEDDMGYGKGVAIASAIRQHAKGDGK